MKIKKLKIKNKNRKLTNKKNTFDPLFFFRYHKLKLILKPLRVQFIKY